MLTAQILPRLSVADYLAYEQEYDLRHELVDGYLYAMAGASDRHEEIVANCIAALHRHLQGSGCRVYGSNLKLRVDDDFFYPDLFLRCAPTRGDPYFKTDPLLIIEVLSPHTQRYDRGDKRLAYQSLPSLMEYVLVAQDRPFIQVWRRVDTTWETQHYDKVEQTLVLQAIDFKAPVATIYA